MVFGKIIRRQKVNNEEPQKKEIEAFFEIGVRIGF